jgi:hypothetical protein
MVSVAYEETHGNDNGMTKRESMDDSMDNMGSTRPQHAEIVRDDSNSFLSRLVQFSQDVVNLRSILRSRRPAVDGEVP